MRASLLVIQLTRSRIKNTKKLETIPQCALLTAFSQPLIDCSDTKPIKPYLTLSLSAFASLRDIKSKFVHI